MTRIGLIGFIVGCASIVAPIAFAQDNDHALTAAAKAELGKTIDRLIAGVSNLDEARVGVWISASPLNEPLYTRLADEAFNSASNTKIITIAAALHYLGPEFRLTTQLFGQGLSPGGDRVDRLTLVGAGDPMLSPMDISNLAAALAHRGIRRVGQVQIDDSYFDNQTTPPHFDEQPKEQAAFRAQVSATSLSFNSFAIHIIPNPSGSGRPRILFNPPLNYFRVVENTVTTEKRGRTRLRVETKERLGHLEVRIRGSIRAMRPRRIYRRIPTPSAFAGALLIAALKDMQIPVATHSIRVVDVDPTATLLASHPSKPLAVLIRGLGKFSNNYMAEVLLKIIGAETDQSDAPASWESGLTAVRRYLVDVVGLTADSFVYENGSGLFDSNRFTPRQIGKVLATASTNPRFSSEMIASLAIGGADGTLRSRMVETDAAHLVHAKTGTLSGVSALSGYVQFGRGDRLRTATFSILINQIPPGKTESARLLQDQIAAVLVRTLR